MNKYSIFPGSQISIAVMLADYMLKNIQKRKKIGKKERKMGEKYDLGKKHFSNLCGM